MYLSSPEASRPSGCRTEEHTPHERGPGGHKEAALDGGGRREVPSGLWGGAVGTQRTRQTKGVAFGGHWGKKRAWGPWRVAERILGRWRSGGSEPCRVCEEDGGSKGSRNLLERGSRRRRSISTMKREQRMLHLLHLRLTGWLVVSRVVHRGGLLVVQLRRLRGVGGSQHKLLGHRPATIGPSSGGQGRRGWRVADRRSGGRDGLPGGQETDSTTPLRWETTHWRRRE